jgi:NADPH-dependent ferric siderophore reductase
VRWLHRGEVSPGCSDLLGQALRSVAVPQGERVHVWIAGEAGALTPLRRWVRDDLGVPRDDVDVTGYWKRGVADFDEEHEEPSRTSRSRSA